MKDQAPLCQTLSDLDRDRVQRSFARGMQSYHENASVQRRIAADLVATLRAQGLPQSLGRVLEFGCGTGHLTSALLDRYQIDALTLNDLVPQTAQPLRAVLRQRGQSASFRFGAIEDLDLPPQLDLIASASTVQWIEDLPACLARLSDHLAPGGWLALSGFGRHQFHQLAELGSKAAAPNYLDAGDWPLILPAGLELVTTRQQAIDLQFSSALELLRHLRRTGVNGQASRGWGRRDLQQFERHYRQRFEREGQLPLTYDAVWILARKTR